MEVRMIPDLPDPNDAHQTTTPIGLLTLGDLTIVEGLVDENDDQNQVEAACCKHHPENVPPGASPCDDEVPKEWGQVRRQDEERYPDANFARMFMEKEHILDARQTDCLKRGQS